MDKNKKKLKYYDIGLAIIRPFLAFSVIMTHFYKSKDNYQRWRKFYEKADSFPFHVPIFMLMSFYFSQKTIISHDYKKKFERLKRLFIPYFIWPLIIFYLNRILKKVIVVNFNVSLKDLEHQYLFGFGHMGVFWFQWNLIIFTIFYYLFALIFKTNLNFILILISITSFIYQYNGKNYIFLNKFNDGRRVTFGRIIEMIPFAASGFIISSQQIIKYLKKYRLKVFLSCIYFIYFLFNYNIFSRFKGSYYHGIKMFLESNIIFIIFAMFPSEKFENKIVIKIIKRLTNHTAGIYYLQGIVFLYIQSYVFKIKQKTLESCIIMYLICYLICFIGSIFLGKTILKPLFE